MAAVMMTLSVALLETSGGAAIVRVCYECADPAQEADKAKELKALIEKRVELEYAEFECGWRCPRGREDWRYDTCLSCGKKRVAPEAVQKGNVSRILKITVGRGVIEIFSESCPPTLSILRLSAVEECVRKAGLKPKRGRMLLGAFALHIGAADPEKVREALGKVEGIQKVAVSDGTVYVNQNDCLPRSSPKRPRVAYDQIEKQLKGVAELQDLSWAVNRGVTGSDNCELGFIDRE